MLIAPPSLVHGVDRVYTRGRDLLENMTTPTWKGAPTGIAVAKAFA